jgi:hypothetical protein
MGQKRKLRGGTVAVASTIYVPEKSDTKAATAAKKRGISKSKAMVEAVQEKYPA